MPTITKTIGYAPLDSKQRVSYLLCDKCVVWCAFYRDIQGRHRKRGKHYCFDCIESKATFLPDREMSARYREDEKDPRFTDNKLSYI